MTRAFVKLFPIFCLTVCWLLTKKLCKCEEKESRGRCSMYPSEVYRVQRKREREGEGESKRVVGWASLTRQSRLLLICSFSFITWRIKWLPDVTLLCLLLCRAERLFKIGRDRGKCYTEGERRKKRRRKREEGDWAKRGSDWWNNVNLQIDQRDHVNTFLPRFLSVCSCVTLFFERKRDVRHRRDTETDGERDEGCRMKRMNCRRQ